MISNKNHAKVAQKRDEYYQKWQEVQLTRDKELSRVLEAVRSVFDLTERYPDGEVKYTAWNLGYTQKLGRDKLKDDLLAAAAVIPGKDALERLTGPVKKAGKKNG